MIQIHDITMPFPWPDKLVKYYDAPEVPFDCTADEEKWLQAKANAIGCHVFHYMLLATGEYEVHMSAELYRVIQMKYKMFADLSSLDPELKHEFMAGPMSENFFDQMGPFFCSDGRHFIHMMRVTGDIVMGTVSPKISQWINEHMSWMYKYVNGQLYTQRTGITSSIPVTLAYQLYPTTPNLD